MLPILSATICGLLLGLVLGFLAGRKTGGSVQQNYVSSPLRNGPAVHAHPPPVITTVTDVLTSLSLVPSGGTHPHLQRAKGSGDVTRPW